MRLRRRKRISFWARVEPAPMTDVVFLLLIFFMLSSSLMLEPGIKVKLPSAVTSEAQMERKVVLTITKDSLIFINERRVLLENLSQELPMAVGKSKEKVVVVKADESVRHGLVVKVMDLAKQAGAERLAIATEPKKK